MLEMAKLGLQPVKPERQLIADPMWPSTLCELPTSQRNRLDFDMSAVAPV